MDTYPVQVHVRVRGRDAGPWGDLDEASLLIYMAEARRAYLDVLNLPPMRLRVAAAGLELLRPAAPGDDLAVRVRVSELGERAVGMQYLVRDRLTREAVARGWTSLVLLDEGDLAVDLPPLLIARVEALEGRALPRPS